MKNIYIAVLITIILTLTGLTVLSFGNEEFANPTLLNTTDTQAVFQYETGVAGTIYYTITPVDNAALSAETVKANVLSGKTSKTVIAVGSVSSPANTPGNFTVTGLSGQAYTLYSSLEVNGTLGAVNVRNFFALKYEEVPSVTQYFSDKFIVKSKFNHTGEIYYAVYKNANGITATDVVNGTLDSNLIFKESKIVPNGLRTTLKLTGLKGGQTYDLVFARKDKYGNLNQLIEVINDVSTKGNALINVVYQNAATDHVNLYFNEAINNVGTISNYVIKFLNADGTLLHTSTESEFSINTSLSSGKLIVLDFDSNFPTASYIKAGGKLEVRVLNGNGFDPAVISESETVTYQFDTTAMVVSEYPMMMNANYQSVSPIGPEGDLITIELNGTLSTTPSAINFKVSIGETLESEALVLVANSDYSIVVHADSYGFDIQLTSAGAIKLKDLPTSYIKVAFSSENPPQLDASASTIYAIRKSSVSTLEALSLNNQPISGFSPTMFSYTVTEPYVVLQAYDMTPAAAMSASPSSQESYLEYQSSDGNVSNIKVYAADGTKSEYTITTVSNELTLGGITINSVPVDYFDPYANTLSYTVTEPLTTPPVLTVTHLPGITETTTYVLSSSIPNTYVYTNVLSKDGDEAIFTIYVTVTAGTNNSNDSKEDRQTKELEIIKNEMEKIATSREAVDTLRETITKLKLINLDSITDLTQKTQRIQAVSETLTQFETELNTVTNPDEQLKLISQLMSELKSFKALVDLPTPAIDKSIQDMVQNTADNFGTVKINTQGSGGIIKVEDASLANLIDRHAVGLKQLNEVQQSYFEATVTRKISATIKLEVSLAENQTVLTVENSPEQLKLLKIAQVESLAVSNVNAEVKMPLQNLSATDVVQFVMEKQIPSSKLTGTDVSSPEIVYDIKINVNNGAIEKLNKPVTLTFNLGNFNLQNESPMDLAIFKLNELTGVWEAQGGIVDPESGKIFVKRDNLSQYTVLKSKKSFTDSDQSWAKAEINAMLNKGIVADSGKFAPQSVLTRGEFAQWIAKAYGLKVSDKGVPFKDVAKTGDTYNAIAAVYQQGLLTGKSNTRFDPNAPLTQNEMAAALGKLLVSFDNKEKSGKVTSKYLSQMKTTQVASWAEDDMALLMELGMNVTEQNGQNPITKEAAAAAFMKFYRS